MRPIIPAEALRQLTVCDRFRTQENMIKDHRRLENSIHNNNGIGMIKFWTTV